MVQFTSLHILAPTSSLVHSIWLQIYFFIIFQTFSMKFISCESPGHSRMGIPLQSRNVLLLLELWHVARSWIKTYPFCGNTTHSHFISISCSISLWYFALSLLPFIFLRRDMPLLLMATQTCTRTGDFTAQQDSSYSVCAKHYNGVNCYDSKIQTHVNVLCSHKRDISLCMILRHAIHF